MPSGEVALVAGLVVLFALVSRRIEGTSITAPMVFVGAGLLIGPEAFDLVDLDVGNESLAVLAELTLVILLFSDAARIDLRTLYRYRHLPVRLLAVAMPLSIVLGTVAGMVVLDLGIWPAAVLAAVLAPTDAALGQIVVSDERVPIRIRQGLNVESGLNDGIAVPFVTLFLALALQEEGVPGAPFWLRFAAQQIGLGLLVGLVVGGVAAWSIDRAGRAGWVADTFRQLAVVAVAVAGYACAGAVGGNGFIAAFVAGLVFGNVARDHRATLLQFAEEEGQLFGLLTFLVFGGVAVSQSFDQLDWRIGVYVVASLTVVRMVPVALGTVGLGFHRLTTLYVGWFGPRGLASIIFALYVVEEAGQAPFATTVFLVAIATVAASVVLHGASAAPLTARYGGESTAMATADPHMPEMEEVAEIPTRWWSHGRS